MNRITRSASLMLVVALFLVMPPPIAHACKMCPGNSIEFSLSRSKAVVLGKVTLVQRSGEKRGRGEATLKVEFQKWIIPPEAKGAALKQKPPKSVEIQTSWDGICLMPPQLPSAGERAIFFLAEWSDGRGVLTGYCSSPILAVAEEKVVIPAESAEEWGSKPILLRTFESKLKKLRKSP